ncbi:unnamed protein product [Vicia faba]|uniref:Uncharacterized protein n=1 Tax=Vicia faba TaxID=3906 RepID=A0AAV1BDS8_VICFA|nr:unnamed protein product [Vicia faba]
MSSSSSDESEHVSTKVDSPTKSSSSSKRLEFHPSLFVTNIKKNIHFVLEMEKDNYTIRDEMFEVHARAHKVVHHIISQPGKEKPASTDTDFEMWITLDSTVLQWIYSTISLDLLTMFLSATPINPLNKTPIIIRTTAMDLAATATIGTATEGVDSVVVHTLMVPQQQLPLILSVMVSLGMKPTSLGYTSFPLPYISMDSPYRNFEVTMHPRLVPSGSH